VLGRWLGQKYGCYLCDEGLGRYGYMNMVRFPTEMALHASECRCPEVMQAEAKRNQKYTVNY
jgi:hypothetical protein